MQRYRVKTNLASPYSAGEAYELAKAAVGRGEIQKARDLKPYMLKSDAGLIEVRIANKLANDQSGGG